MFEAALELFSRRQAQLGGDWELEPSDRNQLLQAAQRLEGAFQRGESYVGLERRLADALDRAEAHAWALGRRLPHTAAEHFGAHLSNDPLEPVRVLSEYGSDSDCHDECFPAVSWFVTDQCWCATHHGYCGDTFAHKLPVVPSSPSQSRHGLEGIELERIKQAQLANFFAQLASAQHTPSSSAAI